MTDSPALFLAVANSTYHTHQPLHRAVPNAQALAAVLEQRHGFQTKILADLDRERLLDSVDAELAPAILAGGRLILAWTGHGEIDSDKQLQLLGRSKSLDVEVADAAKLGKWAARTGARQVLLLLDTCFSGAGLLDAARLLMAVNSGRASPEKSWFGIVAASQQDEPALSGALACELERLLREGPRGVDIRWERHRALIRGDDLVQTLVTEWNEERQNPHPMSSGRAGDLVANPLHEPGAPVAVVEQLLQAAHGGPGDVNFFVGRHAVLSAVVRWLRAGQPGLHVLIGPPGCGKSAVIGRIASLSSAAERERILANGFVSDETDPGVGSVDAQLHARGLTLDAAVEDLLKQLYEPAGDGLYGLLSIAEQRHYAGDPLAVVVDGLDEAYAYSADLAQQLIAPLARHALVLLGTVDVQAPNREPLLKLVGPAAVVTDLGADGGSTRSDIRAYIVRRLEGAHRDMDPRAVADYIAPESGKQEVSFLFARLITSQLRETPVNTSSISWREVIADSVETALERDMESTLLTIDRREHPTAARELLRALALSYGGGFPPDDVWPTVATAISASGTHYTRDDVYGAIEPLARYLIAGAEGDQPVYRIAHQRLTDYLKPESGDLLAAAELHRQVADGVYRLYVEVLDSGTPPRSHQYLWRHAWRHLAAAQIYGLDLLRQLVERDREAFLPDLAEGLEYVSRCSLIAGNPEVAEKCSSEAITLRQEIGKPESLAFSMYQLAAAKLMSGDNQGADQVMSDASAVAQGLPEGEKRRTLLGLVLGGTALAQLTQGSVHSAQLIADEALALSEAPEDRANLPGYCLAVSVKARCSLLTGDFAQAALHANQLIKLAQDAGENGVEMLVDGVGALAAAQLMTAQTAQPDANGTYPSAVGSAAKLVEDLRQLPLTTIAKIDLARGILTVIQAEVLDAAHGLRTIDAENLLKRVDETIEVLRPCSHLAEAAVLFATALRLRWIVALEIDPKAAVRARDDAVAVLRPLASSYTLAQGELGLILDIMTALELGAGVTESQALKTLLDREQEAVELLRKHPAYAGQVPAAIIKLVQVHQTMGNAAEARFYRREAIDATRELTPRYPGVLPQLAALLVDQAQDLMFENPHEARSVAKEALDIACSLEAGHQTDFLMAGAALLLAASYISIGDCEEPEGREELHCADGWDVAALLEEARKRAEKLPADPLRDGLLAGIQLNLAVRALQERRFPDSIAAAQQSLNNCGALPHSVAREDSMQQASLVLGLAKCRAGNITAGEQLVRSVLDPVVEALVAGSTTCGALARLLNTAGDTEWERAISRLAERPDLQLALLPFRMRPKHEVHLTVRAVKKALDNAPSIQLAQIHGLARSQRSFAPKEFDAAWLDAVGDIPPWLQLTPAHVALTLMWFQRRTWLRSKEFLNLHNDLLHAETDIALDELESAGAPAAIVATHRDILAIARRERCKASHSGWCDAAYATVLAREGINEWLHGADMKGYLAEHPDFLANPEVINVLQESAQQDPVFGGLAAVVQLAQRGELALAFKIADSNDAKFVFETLQKAWRALDIDRLTLLATVVKTFNDDPKVVAARTATIALAIARALSGLGDEAESFAREAASEAPPERIADLNGILGEAITHHPTAAATLALCIAAMNPTSLHV